MTKKTRITPTSVKHFAELLFRWSTCNDSYFLKEFWQSFGMTEMQFYKRLWAAEKIVGAFDYTDVKRNLKLNRMLRNKRLKPDEKGKTIRLDFQKQKSESEKGRFDEKETGW